MARQVGRRAPVRGWIAAPLVAVACFLVPVPDWVVEEFYSRDFYPWLQNWMTAVTNWLPFAALDVLIAAALALVLFRIVRDVWSHEQLGGVLGVLADLARRLLRATAVVAILFVGTWGCNYRRTPLEAALSGGTAATPTVATLVSAVEDANASAARLRPIVISAPALTYPELAGVLEAPLHDALAELNQAPLARPGEPKTSYLLSPFFTWSGVTGMVDPIALESIVQPDLLPFERPFVLAHEWSHLAGRADEAEASAIGWFACMNGPPALVYSADLYLIEEAAGSLSAEPRRRALAHLDAGVREDLNAIAHRMQAEKPLVRDTAFHVYDEYLKANRVSDGTASYDRALGLILSSPIKDAMAKR